MFRTTETAFRNTSGMITALPMLNHTPCASRLTTVHRRRKSTIDAAPRLAPETCGCMCTTSVPMATWMVQDAPAR